jgi:3-methyladenine DNA glycosylase AlkD
MVSLREDILKDLKSVSNPKKAETLQWFFKTGKGDYGEGDIFAGIVVPDLRKVAKEYSKLVSFKDLEYFITNEVHEYRLFALLVLTYMDLNSDIYEYYTRHIKNINNWDLVDLSAPSIVGKYLKDKDRASLYDLAKSDNLWKQRISIVATYEYIRNGDFKDTLAISEILIDNKHDLIHKAVGWMLREVGKRDQEIEEEFLRKYYKKMPRTMLRYAIEKFEENKRKAYLKGEI